MSNTTWNGSASTDWATGANWSTGSPPTTGAHVVIPDTSSINNCVLDQTRTIGSLTIQANGTLVGGGFTLNITSEGDASGGTEGFAVNNDGIISGSLNLNITTAATTSCDFAGSSGRFNDVTVNHASCIINLESTFHIDGHLDITLGKIICGGNTVEITGRTDIGPASGGADQATLQCDASAMFLGSGRTSSHALVVNQGGTFTGGSGNHTIGSLNIKNNTNCKCTLTTANTTIDGEDGSTSKAINIEGSNGATNFSHGNGTVIITFNGSSDIKADGVTLNLNNLTINHTDADINTKSNLTCAGDVTITAGILDGEDDAISFGSLTISNNGTYLATSGTTTITNIESGASRSVLNSGTLTHNNGTFLFNGAMDQKVSTNSTGRFNNITLNKSNNDFVFIDSSTTVEGDLDITMGDNTRQCRPSSTSGAITVTGDVIVREGILLRAANDCTGAMSFGSLEIQSGGIYAATSGTTTFTDETSGGYALYTPDGTFIHNNGKVKVDYNTGNKNAHTILYNSGDYYDLEIDMNSVAYEVKLDAPSPSKINILNNLTITTGWVEKSDASDTLDVFGLTNISANGKFMEDANENTNTITHHGLVTNLGTYKINDGTTVKMNSGIRNLGTITVA